MTRRQSIPVLLLGPASLTAAAAEASRLVEGNIKTWKKDPRLEKLAVAFRFLERPDLAALPAGRHEIADGVYANIDKSKSADPAKVQFEAHRKFIDVHYMISGQVTTGYAPVEKLKEAKPYDERDEAAMFHVPARYRKVKLHPGMFAVFFPGGGHMPNCHLDGEHDLHKVVVKVRRDIGMR